MRVVRFDGPAAITITKGTAAHSIGYFVMTLVKKAIDPASTPQLTSCLLLLCCCCCHLCLQNLYRIFYPQSNDMAGLQADSNPWYSPVCQSLPVFP